MINLEELYIGENNVNSILNMPKLKVLNCIGNPIDKIKFFPNLKTLMSSTSKVSSQYIVSCISKIKTDFVITFVV
jgi:Leucine-rich repeat (LRR) protein